MKKDYRAAILAAALVAGCSQVPGTPTSRLVVGPTADSRYGVLDTSATQTQADSVTASSVSNAQWFAASNTIDGNLSSAWGPSASDASPTLTFTLHNEISLSSLAIKMSGAAMTLDVAVSVDGNTWTTVATGLAPTPTVLDQVALSTANATQVRLTFVGQDAANLLVCEVQFFGGPPATPTPAPTPIPSVVPSTAPSCTPPALPSPSCIPSVLPSCVPSILPPPGDKDHGDKDHGDKDHGDRDHGDKDHGDKDHPGHHVDCRGSFRDQCGRDHHKIEFCVTASDDNGCAGDIQVQDDDTRLCFTGQVTALDCDDATNRVTCSGRLSFGAPFTCTFVQDAGGCHDFTFTGPAGCRWGDHGQ